MDQASNSHVACLIHPLTRVVLTSFRNSSLLPLIQGIAALAVKVAKTRRLDKIEACAGDAAEQIDNLLMINGRSFLFGHEPAAPVIRAKCFGFAARPNLNAAVADHYQIQALRRDSAERLSQIVGRSLQPVEIYIK